MAKKKTKKKVAKRISASRQAQIELANAKERTRRGFTGFTRKERESEVRDSASGASMAVRSASRKQIRKDSNKKKRR